MTRKEVIKLFISTFLLFVIGFILVMLRLVTTKIVIRSMKDTLFYIATQVIIMILSGIILYCITNWKSLRVKRPLLYGRKHPEYIRYIKWRGLSIVVFTLIALYYSENGFTHRGLISPILAMIDNSFFPQQSNFFTLKFYFVSGDVGTTLFTLIMLATYIFLEFLFTDKVTTDKVIDE